MLPTVSLMERASPRLLALKGFVVSLSLATVKSSLFNARLYMT